MLIFRTLIFGSQHGQGIARTIQSLRRRIKRAMFWVDFGGKSRRTIAKSGSMR
jgi:hypothetical protein